MPTAIDVSKCSHFLCRCLHRCTCALQSQMTLPHLPLSSNHQHAHPFFSLSDDLVSSFSGREWRRSEGARLPIHSLSPFTTDELFTDERSTFPSEAKSSIYALGRTLLIHSRTLFFLSHPRFFPFHWITPIRLNAVVSPILKKKLASLYPTSLLPLDSTFLGCCYTSSSLSSPLLNLRRSGLPYHSIQLLSQGQRHPLGKIQQSTVSLWSKHV